MNLTPQDTPPATRRSSPLRVGLAVLGVAFVVGLGCDLLGGFELWKGASSRTGWTVGIISFGLLYIAGEAIGGWLNTRDRPTHPLGTRVLHLLALLAVGVLLVAIAYAIQAAVK